MPSSTSATHRAGHGSNRSAASTAKTGTSSVLKPSAESVDYARPPRVVSRRPMYQHKGRPVPPVWEAITVPSGEVKR